MFQLAPLALHLSFYLVSTLNLVGELNFFSTVNQTTAPSSHSCIIGAWHFGNRTSIQAFCSSLVVIWFWRTQIPKNCGRAMQSNCKSKLYEMAINMIFPFGCCFSAVYALSPIKKQQCFNLPHLSSNASPTGAHWTANLTKSWIIS